MTGQPEWNASRIGSPNPSKSDGNTRAKASRNRQREILLRDVVQKQRPCLQAVLRDPSPHGLVCPARASREHQSHGSVTGIEELHRPQQGGVILVRPCDRREQDISVRYRVPPPHLAAMLVIVALPEGVVHGERYGNDVLRSELIGPNQGLP